MDYQIIIDEVINNPKQIAELSFDQSDKWIADTLNTLGISNETIVRESVNTADIVTAIYTDKDEFFNLSQLNLLQLSPLWTVGNIDPAKIQGVCKKIFTEVGFPEIRAALMALATRSCSRSEILYEAGVSLSERDVHIARRRRV